MSVKTVETGKRREEVRDTKYFVKLFIGLFFMFVFGHVCPTWSTVTRMGVQGIGILFGAIWLVSNRFGLVFPSMLGMFAVVASGFLDTRTLLSRTLGGEVVFQLIIVFVFVYAISESGADAVLARWMISRKSLNGRPVRFTVVFLAAISVLATIVSALGAFMFAIAMINSIAKAVGYDDDSQWKKAMMTGAIAMSSVGSAVFPFKGMSLMIFNMFTEGIKNAGLEVNQVAYMVGAFFASIVFAVVLGLVISLFFRIDFTNLKKADIASICKEGGTKMNKKQLTVMIAFVIGFMYSVVLIFLPKEMMGYGIISGIGQGFWFMIVIVVLSVLRFDGEKAIDIEQCFNKAVNWGIVLAVCAFTSIGMMISSKDVGIQTWLGEILGRLFSSMPFPVFVLVLTAATLIMTNFFSNTASAVIIGTLVGPFILSYALEIGINPNAVIPAVVMTASLAFLTMGAGGSSPIYLGLDCMKNDPKWVWKYGPIVMLVEVITVALTLTLFSYIL
jgi:di/tricarboxylate transporter